MRWGHLGGSGVAERGGTEVVQHARERACVHACVHACVRTCAVPGLPVFLHAPSALHLQLWPGMVVGATRLWEHWCIQAHQQSRVGHPPSPRPRQTHHVVRFSLRLARRQPTSRR